jgi:superfamily I DNA/RNA helicase
LRRDGTVIRARHDDIPAGVAAAVQEALLQEGMVGVVAADHHVEHLADVVPASERVQLVASSLAKGLEFDHVIVVEPADIADAHGPETATGQRHLYVAITRAVSHLTIVHSRDLSPELRADQDLAAPDGHAASTRQDTGRTAARGSR